MIIIGLTGSIGMGKTAVAEMLRSMGIPVHDADAAVHALLDTGGAAVDAVGRAFPAALAHDRGGRTHIDRRALGHAVFADPALKKKLEDILHPMVRAQSDAFVREMGDKGHAAAALDIPLLFETGGEKRVDVTLCVSAPADMQRRRVLSRPGMTEEKFARILAAQMPDTEKRKRADYVVDTGCDIEETRRQLMNTVQAIMARYRKNH